MNRDTQTGAVPRSADRAQSYYYLLSDRSRFFMTLV